MKLISKKRLKRFLLLLLGFFVLTTISVLSIDYYVSKKTSEKIYTQVNKIPPNKVGLLLGTSKYLSSGHINLYYKYRIEAVTKLYRSGKIKFILISGDNGSKSYNEPELMKQDLVENNIPEANIFLDYAGFRTLDSVLRAQKIFGQNTFTVISQEFHNERALYLAHHFNIEAIAYNAKDVKLNYGFKTQLREKLARCKMMLDLLFKVEPKYLGDPIKIE
ncbi:SanA/YdcF family protein [Mesonia mobilis]|uniref:SanA/YdcF family protein n=1 Tax=Mesonia mobilis TaxID=369791 RepID=UPI0026EBA3AC|nr:ElyC/SanA/YdcF family protein [Mesonia mobilis]